MILRQSADGIAAAQRGMARREDVRDNLWEIKVPTLCIVRLSDVISKPDEMQEIATTLPSGKLLEIPGGHLTPMENADAVTAGIREFCRGL